MVSRRFYITTPEDSETLSKVNVLVLDHVEEPDCIVSRKVCVCACMCVCVVCMCVCTPACMVYFLLFYSYRIIPH